MMFKTLDQKRKQFITRRDRLFRWLGGFVLAILLVVGVYFTTLFL